MKRLIIFLASVLFLAPLTLVGVAQATPSAGGHQHHARADQPRPLPRDIGGLQTVRQRPDRHRRHHDHDRPRRLHRLALPPGPGVHRGHPGNAHRLRRRRPQRARRTPTPKAPASSMQAWGTCTSPATRATGRSPWSRPTSTSHPQARNGSTHPHPATARSRTTTGGAADTGLRQTRRTHGLPRTSGRTAGRWTDRPWSQRQRSSEQEIAWARRNWHLVENQARPGNRVASA